MLTAFVVVLTWYLVGSITLVTGMSSGNRRQQLWGMGCLFLLTLGILVMSVAHDRSLPYRGFTGSMLR